ncbi:MAG TPA: GAF domain-containing sensor histidine kinase [Ignavibacteriaceae bacterium]|nr:GAF domain-containing sensor histidine kinase [Ignavibacteriaceae bacterium]
MKFSEFKSLVDNNSVQDVSAEKLKNLELILDIVKSINGSLILEDVLELVLKNAIKLTNSDRGFIVLKNPSGNLEFKLGLNADNKSLPESSFHISNSVVQDVSETGQSRFIENAQGDNDNDPSKSILVLELQTILCSPLIAGGKKIGVIYVDSKHLHKINVSEITKTFEILAGQAAIAIANAQLYINQVTAYNALNEVNAHLIQIERKALKSSINSEIGQSVQGLVHLALLETESLIRIIEKSQKDIDPKQNSESLLFDRLKLKVKIAIDSIRNIQKYAQVLQETSVQNLNKDNGDLNSTILSVIKLLSPMKKFNKVVFKSQLNALPLFQYDPDQFQHLFVHLFNNSAEAKYDSIINIKTWSEKNKILIHVSDNGHGISEENKKKIFALPDASKTGYGLFLCNSIVERHNGTIELMENVSGTSFLITLPIN